VGRFVRPDPNTSPLEEVTETQHVIPILAEMMRKTNISVFRVERDSMIGDHLLDSDHLILEKLSTPCDGDMVVAMLRNGEATLKRFYRDGRRIRFEAADRSGESIFFEETEVEIRGVVLGIVRKARNSPGPDGTRCRTNRERTSWKAENSPKRLRSMIPAPLILHVDADAFFASVEQALDSGLKGRAVIVGGGDRGVVSAASYEARQFGVHSAMPMVQARKLCPHASFLGPNFRAYKEFSKHMFDIMRIYSPLVEATSVDEGYIDLTGTLKLHKAPAWEVAHRLLSEIRSTLGIKVSGGLAGTKSWAKMATSLAKPNGLLYLEAERASLILGFLPASAIPGVGKKADEILRCRGILTVADVAAAQLDLMRGLLGQWGERLVDIASGKASRTVDAEPSDSQKSYSKDRTLEKDTVDYPYVRVVARELAQRLAERLRADGRAARTVTFKVRYADFTDVSRSMTVKEAVDGNQEILKCLDQLFRKTITRGLKVRQVGVKLSGIEDPLQQTNLFDTGRLMRKKRDQAVDDIRRRFGFDAVRITE
jgi:DNA polymerase IV